MKRILCLAMTLLMVIGAPMTAFAAEQNNGMGSAPGIAMPDWTVTFNGSQMKSDLKGDALQNKIENVQPGDSVDVKVEIVNASSKKTDWYMSNEIIQAMEDNKKASGGAYTYILKYIDPTGKETEIYNSRTVGGEAPSNSGEQGLREIEGIDSPFYLDRLNPNESASVSLYVKLDGETIVNSYQSNLTILNLNFAVEKIKEGTITKEVTKVKTETVATVVPTMVQTGDSAPILLFSTVTFASALVLIAIAVKTMTRRRSEKGEL